MEEKILSITKTSDGLYTLEIIGMKETFSSLEEIKKYADTITNDANERLDGNGVYLNEEIDGSVSIIHNKTKHALRLKSCAECKMYADLVKKAIEKHR